MWQVEPEMPFKGFTKGAVNRYGKDCWPNGNPVDLFSVDRLSWMNGRPGKNLILLENEQGEALLSFRLMQLVTKS